MRARLFSGLRSSLSQRAARWARRRQGIDLLPLTLGARRIYILPGHGGIGFGLLLLTMLIAGLNYTNSLALFLTFTLAGFALVAMVQCHRRLLGVTLESITAAPAFAGGEVRIDMVISAVPATQVGDLRATVAGELALATAGAAATGVAAGGQVDHASLSLRSAVDRRGIWRLARVGLHTTAPFGLFRAWVWIHADVETLIYPKPAGELPIPATPGDEAGTRERAAGLDEWATLRPFRDGDSPRQVAWKAYAGGAPLLVKEYQGNASRLRVFDFQQLAGLDVEQRLSQLTRWIVDAAARGEPYTLALPGQRLGPGSGAAHRHRCLAALALHGLERQAP